MSTLKEQLLALQDISYREFHIRLIPTVDPSTVIGIRTPQLRSFAAKFAKEPQAAAFLSELPHYYYEENNLHGMLISQEKNFEKCIFKLNSFLPYINNWATCDMLSPRVLITQPELLLKEINKWLHSDKAYTVRFAIGRLMAHFSDARFSIKYPKAVAEATSDEYYVNMMRAWYFATLLAKQYDAVLPFFKERRLDKWTHNKAIQKAVESLRVAPEHKQELKKLRL